MRSSAVRGSPAHGTGARASRVRGSPRSGRQPRLTDAPAATLNSEARIPPRIRAFSFLVFHFGCAPALRRRKTSRCTRRRDVRGRPPASCSETPPPTGGLAWGHSRSGSFTCRVRLAGQDAGLSHRGRGFKPRTRCHRPEVAQALTPRDANRPQRLGGSGTRHRNLFLDVAKWSKATDCKSVGASPRQFEPDRRVQCVVRLGVAVAQWQSPGLWAQSCQFDSDRPPPSACFGTHEENHHETRFRRPRQLLRSRRPASVVAASPPRPA